MSPQGHQQNLSLGTHPVDNAELCYPRDNIVELSIVISFFLRKQQTDYMMSQKSQGQQGTKKKAQSSQKKQKNVNCCTV